ncbi:MAG TPA: hypothetical protein VGK61_00920 [Planctomycetota bacterium]|jgi:hypothetical protein
MLDKIRKLLGVKDIPEEVTPLYRGARSEREALALLKEARRRDEQRRRRAIQDLEVFGSMEEELLEEGKGEVSESRRLMLARRIKEIRGKVEELNARIENIYNKRIAIFNEHIASLETVLELTTEELPDKKTMEEMAIRARELLENLEKSKELAQGIAQTLEPPQPDEEEKKILREMERRADLDLEKAEIEKLGPESEKPETPEAEPRSKERTEKPKAPEQESEEKPEIEFED